MWGKFTPKWPSVINLIRVQEQEELTANTLFTHSESWCEQEGVNSQWLLGSSRPRWCSASWSSLRCRRRGSARTRWAAEPSLWWISSFSPCRSLRADQWTSQCNGKKLERLVSGECLSLWASGFIKHCTFKTHHMSVHTESHSHHLYSSMRRQQQVVHTQQINPLHRLVLSPNSFLHRSKTLDLVPNRNRSSSLVKMSSPSSSMAWNIKELRWFLMNHFSLVGRMCVSAKTSEGF